MYTQNINHKSIECKLECINEGKFCGYASIFNIADHHHDIILPKSFINLPENIKFLWQHEHTQPIGNINNIYEDRVGLYIEGQFALETQKGREAFHLVKRHVLDGLSIGYIPINYFEKDGFRHITKLEVWEISLVTFPANHKARIIDTKATELLNNITQAQKALLT